MRPKRKPWQLTYAEMSALGWKPCSKQGTGYVHRDGSGAFDVWRLQCVEDFLVNAGEEVFASLVELPPKVLARHAVYSGGQVHGFLFYLEQESEGYLFVPWAVGKQLWPYVGNNRRGIGYRRA